MQYGIHIHTLNATCDLLVFFILIALFTCFPGSSTQGSACD
jgi:hypothetical protein